MADDKSVVFVVDDEQEMRDSLADLLRAVGRRVVTFSSSESFLKSFDSSVPSCLVLDVRMPGMDGIELLRELRKRSLSVPTVVITAYGDVPMAVDALKLGAMDFIQKPYRAQSLLGSVARCIDQDVLKHQQDRKQARLAERLDRLTRREREVAVLLATGKSGKQIASELFISYNTLQNHRQHVMDKTGAGSVAELTLMVLEAGTDQERRTIHKDA
ncbi:MAG: response regulator transcription factor [Planctomycetes bacterium]|nr:response regulator transcription factor [Planctomycetota bacterium]